MKSENRGLHKIIFLFIISLVFPLSGFAQKLNNDSALIQGKLKNGLTYYIYPNDFPKGEAVYRLFIKTGSINEKENQKGLAHFLEHMAFNGTKHFPNDGIIRFLESRGARFGKDLNAHTSFNETVYKLQLPTNSFEIVDSTMTILADWAGNLTLGSKEIDKERGVIMSEWLSKTGPKHDIQEAFLLEILNNSRFSDRIVIGDTAVIQNFDYDVLRDYYTQWYDPSIMAVAVVGDIDPQMIEKMIKDKFGVHKSVLKKKDVKNYTIPNYDQMEAKILTESSLDKVELNIIQLMPAFESVKTEKDYSKHLHLSLLNRLIRNRFSSLSFDNQPYKKASLGMSNLMNATGILLGTVNLSPEKIEEGIKTYAEQVEQIYRYGFVPLEIEKIKTSYLSQLKRLTETDKPYNSSSIMDMIYRHFFSGEVITTPQLEYDLAKKHIDEVDSASIVHYMQELVDWDKTHFFMTAFDRVKEDLPGESELITYFKNLQIQPVSKYTLNISIPDELITDYPVAGDVVKRGYIKDIEADDLELSNGARVLFRKSVDKKDRIMISAFRKGGLYSLDPKDYVSGIFSGSIVGLSGAGEFSREALSHYLTGKTVSMRFLPEKTRTGLVGSSSNEYRELMFQLLYLKWTKPNFDVEMYNQIREKSIEAYLTKNETQTAKFFKDLGYLLQGKSYINRELTDTIIKEELDKEKILPIYKSFFDSATDYTFVIIGDCELEDIEPLILEYIGGLPSGKPQTDYIYTRPEVLKRDTIFKRADSPSPKATVSLIYQDYEIPENERIDELKGEFFKSILRMKLLKTLREEMGMIYSVGVSVGATNYPSPLYRATIGFNCDPQNVDQLIGETRRILQELAVQPEKMESEFQDVKLNLLKEMKLKVQRDAFWSAYIRNTVFNNQLDWDYLINYESIVENLSVSDISDYIVELLKKPLVQAILLPEGNK
ncbi:MAG: insulinase family protein [Bacteroides sp.]|nr:insulinase family protein [Bacteroides sp.]